MKPDTSISLYAETLQRLTYDLARYTSLCDRVCTENLGITGTQGYTLLALPGENSISMNDLSLKMRLASSTMTRMVDQLVQKGLVERESDPDDRRVVRVRLSQRGELAQRQLQEALQSFFQKVLSQIPENRHESMFNSLTALNAAIQNALECCDEPEAQD